MDVDKLKAQYAGQHRNHLKYATGYMGGMSFRDLPHEPEYDDAAYPVEVEVLQVREKLSKAGNTYYSVKVRDDADVTQWVTIFDTDMDHNYDTLRPGKCVRLQVKLPTPPFSSFTLASRPRRAAGADARVVPLPLPIPPKHGV